MRTPLFIPESKRLDELFDSGINNGVLIIELTTDLSLNLFVAKDVMTSLVDNIPTTSS